MAIKKYKQVFLNLKRQNNLACHYVHLEKLNSFSRGEEETRTDLKWLRASDNVDEELEELALTRWVLF